MTSHLNEDRRVAESGKDAYGLFSTELYFVKRRSFS